MLTLGAILIDTATGRIQLSRRCAPGLWKCRRSNRGQRCLIHLEKRDSLAARRSQSKVPPFTLRIGGEVLFSRGSFTLVVGFTGSGKPRCYWHFSVRRDPNISHRRSHLLFLPDRRNAHGGEPNYRYQGPVQPPEDKRDCLSGAGDMGA